MIRPEPHKLVCPKCGHSKTVRPKSDALEATDFIGTCPKCNTPMERKELNIIEKIFGR